KVAGAGSEVDGGGAGLSRRCCVVIPGWSEGPDPESRDSGLDASHRPGMTRERSTPRLAAAEQKHALLAEHVPEPPGHAEPQGPAVEIERDRALHLDVDLVAELHEILDGAEVNVRRVVPGGGEVFGAWHVPAHQQLQPHLPEAEIRERDD